MEEDIDYLKRHIKVIGKTRSTEAIENLINKYKEQEKMIELMAEFYAKGNTILGTKEQIIECFREKAKGE